MGTEGAILGEINTENVIGIIYYEASDSGGRIVVLSLGGWIQLFVMRFDSCQSVPHTTSISLGIGNRESKTEVFPCLSDAGEAVSEVGERC